VSGIENASSITNDLADAFQLEIKAVIPKVTEMLTDASEWVRKGAIDMIKGLAIQGKRHEIEKRAS
jgi:hypothetical protein